MRRHFRLEATYDYGYVPGMDSIAGSYRLSRAVVDVIEKGMTPAESLAALQKDAATAIEKAKENKK